MNEQELDVLIEKNLESAFVHFNKVSEEVKSSDDGDTLRILSLVEDYILLPTISPYNTEGQEDE